MTTGLCVEGASFSYGRRAVFSDITIEIPRGEIWGLVGRSGVGKTTLLNVVLGLFKPSAGCVTVDGEAIDRPGRIRGVVFNNTSLLPWLSVIENVLFPSEAMQDAKKVERARALLDEAGLGGSLQLLPKQLSAGMVRRVELIRALMLDEEFFVADEPFAGLDVHTRIELHRIWLRLTRTHPRTGILCTHDPAEAILLCGTVMVLRASGGGGATLSLFRNPHGVVGGADGSMLTHYDRSVRSLIEAMG